MCNSRKCCICVNHCSYSLCCDLRKCCTRGLTTTSCLESYSILSGKLLHQSFLKSNVKFQIWILEIAKFTIFFFKHSIKIICIQNNDDEKSLKSSAPFGTIPPKNLDYRVRTLKMTRHVTSVNGNNYNQLTSDFWHIDRTGRLVYKTCPITFVTI